MVFFLRFKKWKAISSKWNKPKLSYEQQYEDLKLGEYDLVQVTEDKSEPEIFVATLIAQESSKGRPLHKKAFQKCLQLVKTL